MALSKPLTTANHADWSRSVSTHFSIANSLRRFRCRTTVDCHQSSSWPGWTIAALNKWSRWSARNRERAFLRDVADSQQLLNELGLTREQALSEANRPFWE
jgi:uncharacterized protein YjiS (DUF1127 family)